MTCRLRLALCSLALALVSCSSEPTTTIPAIPIAPSISDGAHLGNGHFFFLPPMVSNPSYSGTADPNANPGVMICEWNGSSCAAVIAGFSTTEGTGSERILYDAPGGFYQVNWHTNTCITGSCTLDPAKTYRLRVLAGAVELGHADLDVVNSGKDLKNVQTNEYIGLVNGRTLPVKFRIEQGAAAILPAGGTVTVGAAGGQVTSSDGKVGLTFPAGALVSGAPISITPVMTPPPGAGSWSPVVDLGPNGQTFTEPVTLTLAYDPDLLPDGIVPSALGVYTFDGTGWVPVPGAIPNEIDNTLSVPISHFSVYGIAVWPGAVNGVPTPTSIGIGQQTQLNSWAWVTQTTAGQYCYWRRSWFRWVWTCRTYPISNTYPIVNIAVNWNSATPAVATLPAGPTYTNVTGVAVSPRITGVAPGQTAVRGSAAGVTSSPVTITVLGQLGLLPRNRSIVAGWSVGQNLTRSLAQATQLDVSITNKNSFLVVAEGGTANYTYGGQTGTYSIGAGATSKTLTIAGLGGPGIDTIIASGPGHLPDTAVVTLVQGKFLVAGWPTSLAVGDSAALTVTVADQSGALGNLGYPISVALAPSAGLVFSNGNAALTAVSVQQRTSGTFYVKATATGTQSVTLSHRDYVAYTNSIAVGPPPTIGFAPSSVTIPVQQGAVNSAQIQITNTGGGTLNGLSAGTFSNYFNGSPAPWVTASLNSATAPATLTITAAPTTAIGVGVHQLRIDLSAPGATNSPVTFYSINITVIAAGVSPVNATIVANPTSLSVSVPQGQSAVRQIAVSNSGPDPLANLTVGTFSNYFNGSPAPWVTATVSPTTAPATITITAAPGTSIPLGSHQLRFDVMSPGATNSPLTFYSINVTVEPAPPVPQFTLSDLGTLGGSGQSEAFTLNGSGRIVGVSNQQGFYMDAGATAPTQVPNPFGDIWWAYDVNASGLIAATQPYSGYTYNPATNAVVGPPPGPFTQNNRKMVFALNNTGMVLACSDNGAFAQNYVWTLAASTTTLIPNAYNFCLGRINDAGVAIANADPGAGGNSRLWNQSSSTVTLIPSLGGVTIGRDLNANSIAVGSSVLNGQRRAFRFDPATGLTQNLGTLGGSESEAMGINDAGYIVGWSLNAAGEQRGFLWDPTQQRMFELVPLPGKTESQANDINQNGVIVGYSSAAGIRRATRWTPQ